MQTPLKPLTLQLNYEPFIHDYVSIAKKIVTEKLANKLCKIFIYGSRANGGYHRFSDLNIGIIPLANNPLFLSELEDHLNFESVVPFKIKIINFSFADESFRKHAMRNVIWWKE